MKCLSAYIAGPMRGLPRFNFDAFFEVQYEAELRGFHPLHNPAGHDLVVYPDIETWPGYPTGDVDSTLFDLEAAMRWDLVRVAESDTIIMLPGWVSSSGARTERNVAERTGSAVYLAQRCDDAWSIALDPEQRRMADPRVIIEIGVA